MNPISMYVPYIGRELNCKEDPKPYSVTVHNIKSNIECAFDCLKKKCFNFYYRGGIKLMFYILTFLYKSDDEWNTSYVFSNQQEIVR